MNWNLKTLLHPKIFYNIVPVFLLVINCCKVIVQDIVAIGFYLHATESNVCHAS